MRSKTDDDGSYREAQVDAAKRVAVGCPGVTKQEPRQPPWRLTGRAMFCPTERSKMERGCRDLSGCPAVRNHVAKRRHAEEKAYS